MWERSSANVSRVETPISLIYLENTNAKLDSAINCGVCMQPIKKHAMICSECSLICHSKCAPDANVAQNRCDVRSRVLQLALYAQDMDTVAPLEILARHLSPPSPMGQSATSSSPTPDSPGQGQPSQPPREAPPTAFKMFGAFKRSRSSLNPTPEPAVASSSRGTTSMANSREDVAFVPSSSPPTGLLPRTRKPSVLRRARRDSQTQTRTLSAGSSGGEGAGTPNRSSLRSAATAGESVSGLFVYSRG